MRWDGVKLTFLVQRLNARSRYDADHVRLHSQPRIPSSLKRQYNSDKQVHYYIHLLVWFGAASQLRVDVSMNVMSSEAIVLLMLIPLHFGPSSPS